MIERKCLSCGTWNKEEDNCIQCGNPISPKEIIKIETKRKKLEEANKPATKFEIFAESLKKHKYFLVRMIYKIGYGIGIIFAAIGAFIAWGVAMANG
jgi:hypothetical protein